VNSKLALFAIAVLATSAGRATDLTSDPVPDFYTPIQLTVAQPVAPAAMVLTGPIQQDNNEAKPAAELKPGQYLARPFTLRVIVPGVVDQSMITAPPMDKQYSGRIIAPPVQFIPISPHLSGPSTAPAAPAAPAKP
jgi:hypothetical protein